MLPIARRPRQTAGVAEPHPHARDDGDRLLHAGSHLELRARGRWEYAHRPNCTAIVAVFAEVDGHLLCVEQHRPPVDAVVLEVPAGLAGDDGDADEPLETAARRELLEETGYEAATWESITVGPPSAGLSDEVVTFFRAAGLTKTGDGGGVDGEAITVRLVPLATAAAWIGEWAAEPGRLVDPKVWAALWWLVATPVPGVRPRE